MLQNLMWTSAGIRTSTLLLAFIMFAVGLLVRRSLVEAVLAPVAWLLGWESAWRLTTYLVAPGGGTLAPVWWIGGAAVVLAFAAGVRVEWRWVALTAGLWGLWLATGWHYNLITNPHVDWLAEALNESAKMAWGMAYLWPMLRRSRPAPASRLAVDPGAGRGVGHSDVGPEPIARTTAATADRKE